MKKERKEKHFLPSPEYRGGLAAMRAFIAKELKFPEAALKAGIHGSVYLRYGINNKGKVVETKVISGLGFGCDEEAERVVRLLKFDVNRVRKLRIMYHKKIRVWFRKPKVKNQTERQSISYHITPSKRKESSAPKSKSHSYTITIK